MPGNDHLGIELEDPIERGKPVVEASGHEGRQVPAQDVSGEEHAFGRKVHERVPLAMARSDVNEMDLGAVEPEHQSLVEERGAALRHDPVEVELLERSRSCRNAGVRRVDGVPEALHVLGTLRANALGKKMVREYLGVRKELVSPRMTGVLVSVHDAARRLSPHLPEQLTHALCVREVELGIDHQAPAGVDEPRARVPRSRPVGNAGVDVVADFFELHRHIDLFDKFDRRRIA